MAIRNHHIHNASSIALKSRTFHMPATLAASQTNTLCGAWSPGYSFQITNVSLFCISNTGLTSVDVLIAPTNGGTGVSALASQVAPTNATEVAGTISTTLASTRTAANSGKTSQIQIKYTSASGSPVTSGCSVNVQYRPWPLNAEIGY